MKFYYQFSFKITIDTINRRRRLLVSHKISGSSHEPENISPLKLRTNIALFMTGEISLKRQGELYVTLIMTYQISSYAISV